MKKVKKCSKTVQNIMPNERFETKSRLNNEENERKRYKNNGFGSQARN